MATPNFRKEEASGTASDYSGSVINPRNGFVNKENLDRVLVNWAWRNLFEHATVTAMSAISSYHSPIILWPQPKESSGKSFKYEAMWEEHPELGEVIKEAWGEDVEGKNCG
ncbi:hypothetical protein SESBI_40676 [Sesbania bispinosa]|nr:hypothetical protein SESBI_40676 [Sesbania bispinosa]